MSASTCCITQDLAADGGEQDDDDDDDASALMIDESATEQFELLDSGKMLCSTPVKSSTVAVQQTASMNRADDSTDAAKRRQLWLVVKRRTSPTQISSGNNLHCLSAFLLRLLLNDLFSMLTQLTASEPSILDGKRSY